MPPVAWIGLASARMISPSGSGGAMLGEVLGDRLAGDGEGVAVQQARVEQRLHDDRDAADAVDVVHDVPAERLQVGEVRHLVADAVEVVEGRGRPRPRGRSRAGAARRWSSRRAP